MSVVADGVNKSRNYSGNHTGNNTVDRHYSVIWKSKERPQKV